MFGLARGGVPVAAVIAEELDLPLEVLIVRKLGAPANPELAAGAVADLGGFAVNESLARSIGTSLDALRDQADVERKKLRNQSEALLKGRQRVSPHGRDVILVDDGLATGASMTAAVRSIRESRAHRVTVCVPVASREAVARARESADRVLSLSTPDRFRAVGQWYEDFGQVSNSEVRSLLDEHDLNRS